METGTGVNFYLAWVLAAAVVAAAFLTKVLFFSSMVVTGIGR